MFQSSHRKSYDIDHLFSRTCPGDERLHRYDAVRAAARVFAEVIVETTPAGPDQDDALRHLRKAMLMAREAIVLNGDLYECETLARRLAERVFQPVAAQEIRVHEIRMNMADAQKLVGHAHFDRLAVDVAEGPIGTLWGITVTVSSDVPVGQVVTIGAGDGDDGDGGAPIDVVQIA